MRKKMRDYFERALSNVVKFGDTDIFPFPIEKFIFFDNKNEVLDLLVSIHADFFKKLVEFPPANEAALAPVSYTGFRWATQLDPVWNVYFLGVVLSIADDIENVRVPKELEKVFSYRCSWDQQESEIFHKDFHWRTFMECSLQKAKKYKYVVVCDISEFYPRLGHHRLDNALRQMQCKSDAPKRIMDFLSNFSGTNSFGLPVGGPAARILSELVLNQIDKLLIMEGIDFCRFADDYHLFCTSTEGAYANLIYLSEKLLLNQGLQLQKSKTRIMSGSEFISTSPLKLEEETTLHSPSELQETSQSLLRLSLRFDPYSANAIEDYERLKSEISKFDIVQLLKSELSKSKIHVSLAKKIVSAIKFLDQKQKNDAVLSLVENTELLYPIMPGILVVTKSIFEELDDGVKKLVIEKIIKLINDGSHVFRVDLHLGYAIRLLSCYQTPESVELLARIYKTSTSSLIRKDIILIMANWRNWYWLSDLKVSFRTLAPAERRSFIIASYFLSDEGKHWRDHTSSEFSPFEKIIKEWISKKVSSGKWSIPL